MLRRACKFAKCNCYDQMLSHYFSLEGNQKLLFYLAKHAPSGMKSKAMLVDVTSSTSHQVAEKVQLDLENVSSSVLADRHSIAPGPTTSGTGDVDAIVNSPSALESSTSENAYPTADLLPPTGQTGNAEKVASTTEQDAQTMEPGSAASGDGDVGVIASPPSTASPPPTDVTSTIATTPASSKDKPPIASTTEEDVHATMPGSATSGEGTTTSAPPTGVTSITATAPALRNDKPPTVKRKRKTIDDEDFVDLDSRSRGKPKQVKRYSNRRRTDDNAESFDVEAIVDFRQEPGVSVLLHTKVYT